MHKSSTQLMLEHLSSNKELEGVQSSYNDVAEALRETTAPTNNMLLSMMLSEMKKLTNDIAFMRSDINKLYDISNRNEELMCDLISSIRIQNEILSSTAIKKGTSSSAPAITTATEWFYQGIKLSGKYHIYACILFHLISIIDDKLILHNVKYEDSVDCDFNLFVTVVRMSCERVSVKVPYKDRITLSEKGSQSLMSICPLVASNNKNTSTSLLESRLEEICNSVTKTVMDDIEKLRQRLVWVDCILSAKQIDILKSIKFPIVAPGDICEINWNPEMCKGRRERPETRTVQHDFTQTWKKTFITYRLSNIPVPTCMEKIKASKPV